MPDHLNRSPCTTTLTLLLQESVSGQLDGVNSV
ncbi:hypothetical protein DESA109040_05945 [Deinococcus saxicola]